jgi:hypothetical protein
MVTGPRPLPIVPPNPLQVHGLAVQYDVWQGTPDIVHKVGRTRSMAQVSLFR